MSPAPLKPHSETVSFGHDVGGTVHVKPQGAEAYGPHGEYVATFPSLREARKALFDLHQASQAGLQHG